MRSCSGGRVEAALTYKTKVIQFLGRTTPIILQNVNGPCPLLAICNVLLLKNSLNLSPDSPEVSQENLLSHLVDRLIDSNSNVDDKDPGVVQNQLHNIADAIDLLPRLTTGIDVNIHFKGINEFEFTRECAIFDMLDIPLYHGWIVDPQDTETYNAVGSKSYNTIMADLVGLETVTTRSKYKKKTEEYSVDFVTATTASLMLTSPGLSRGSSFNDYARKLGKGDLEEELELKLNIQENGNQSSPKILNVVSSTVGSEGTKQAQDQSVLEPSIKEQDNQSVPTSNIGCSAIDAKLIASGALNGDVCDSLTPGSDSTESIYAGKECIVEPEYEGELIKDFLKTNASQLTVYGLICLQEQLKERELCVFFRNNHFNTMFKLGGELYILATDQGYINQPDLVWEKLNEVNGNTVFMTGSFKEFKAEEDHAVDTWDEHSQDTTAEYPASIDDGAWNHFSFDSDQQLAWALQEMEYEEQPEPCTEQEAVTGGSSDSRAQGTGGGRRNFTRPPRFN